MNRLHGPKAFSKQNPMFARTFRQGWRWLLEVNRTTVAALQKATEGVILKEEMYLMACRALDCHPSNGISLDALKLTYASDGADIGMC
jgi:hypothetical protein